MTSSQEHPRRWQEVIWRAWRNGDDEEFAAQLFDVVAGEPAGWQATAGLILWGGLYGASAGLLIYLLVMGMGTAAAPPVWQDVTLSLWLGGGLGSAIALVTQIVLGWRLSWRQWLGRLAPNLSLAEPLLQRLGPAGRLLGSGRGTALVGGLVGGGFLGPIGGLFGAFLAGLIYMAATRSLHGPWLRTLLSNTVIFGLVGGAVGGVFGLVLGMLMTLTGLAAEPLMGWAIALVIALLVGQVIGFLIGLDLGMVGALLFSILGGALGGTLIALVTHPTAGLITGLFIVLVNGLIGILRGSPHAWRWRRFWLWWRRRPRAAELEAALERACQEQPPAKENLSALLRGMALRKRDPGPPGQLIQALQSHHWGERLIARHALVALGGAAVEPLRTIAEDRASPLRPTALWLLEGIAEDTASRLADRAETLLCPRCLARFGEISTELSGDLLLTYYGCLACGQSRESLEWAGEVVAVLDARMQSAYAQEGETLWGNWLVRRSLFDFDRVEIARATDEDVERFAVQVANDVAPWRQSRYHQLPCRIAPDCNLSENTLRILRNLFGRVETLYERSLEESIP